MRDFTGLLKLADESRGASGMSRGDKWRLAGTASIATGLALPIPFLIRGKFRGARAMKLLAADAAKYGGDPQRVSEAIYRHIRRTGARLPLHEFVKEFKDVKPDIINGKYRTSLEGPVKILEDGTVIHDEVRRELGSKGIIGKILERIILMKTSGPAYAPKGDFITPGAGRFRHLSPTALLHELGHAADYDNLSRVAKEIESKGNPFDSPYKLKPKDWIKAIFNPRDTGAFKLEQRAWDNARVSADNEIRQAALGTYDNYLRMQGLSNSLGSPLVYGGMFARGHGKKLNKAEK